MSSIFTQMLQGQEAARFVWQDDFTAAIVSSTPVKPGHCTVFPREQVENWLDLSPELHARLVTTCQRVGRAIQETCHPVRVGLAIVSIIVPHVHIHLVPIDSPGELNFTKQDQNARADALDAIAEQLRAFIARNNSPKA